MPLIDKNQNKFTETITVEVHDTDYELEVGFYFEPSEGNGFESQYGNVDYYDVISVHHIEECSGRTIRNDFSVFLKDDEFTDSVIEGLKQLREGLLNEL